MDKPTWNDTLRAAFGSCVPCLACGTSSAAGPNPDSDDEYTSNDGAIRGIRRARADELEGLLHDSSSGDADEGWRDDDAAADADAISLHSHLGPRGRRRPPPRTPRHIALWGFNLFGTGRRGAGVALEGGDEALHGPNSHPNTSTAANGTADASTPRRSKRRGSAAGHSSTSDLFARAALEPAPTQLQDVTEADIERRARRKARKEMRKLAAALAADADAENPSSPSHPGFEGAPPEFHGHPHLNLTFHPAPVPHRGIPSPFLPHPPPQDAAQDDDEADLDGMAYARLAPRPTNGSQSQSASRSSGRSSNSGASASASPYGYTGVGQAQGIVYVGMPAPSPITKTKKTKSKSSGRSAKSKSSATSSTLASPPPSATSFSVPAPRGGGKDEDEFGPFAAAGGGEEEFDGTPGGFSVPPTTAFEEEEDFDGTPGGLSSPSPPYSPFDADEAQTQIKIHMQVPREALPSPGLSRGGGGFNFSAGGARGMGGF
ncbi:hypothetical protein B0H19DRAFT_1144357 [Mycena capillaripes]|nr:hypothetical protein B0H19DRAFT_1144357 [Mycena capillaripes]